ncbi:MAG TPA: hypothetical protein VLT51_13835, partial [Anaerolineales bacterium]|nr:hypothetical protein [Anaerolineales bacterium]
MVIIDVGMRKIQKIIELFLTSVLIVSCGEASPTQAVAVTSVPSQTSISPNLALPLVTPSPSFLITPTQTLQFFQLRETDTGRRL